MRCQCGEERPTHDELDRHCQSVNHSHGPLGPREGAEQEPVVFKDGTKVSGVTRW